MPATKSFFLVVIAMVAFAANSVLCRLALDIYDIDPSSFSLLRLLSGAIALFFIVSITNRRILLPTRDGEWRASVALVVYILGFSFAYISLDAGMGALILFSVVQLTMMLVAIYEGERPSRLETVGWLMAVIGILVLTVPGASAPSPSGFLLMTIAGIAWAVYTLRGRSAVQPLRNTSGNFFYALLISIVPCAFFIDSESVSWQGVVLAIASGAIASGVGYAIWYAVLPHISTLRAALVQLSVPVIAAIGGIVFISEDVSFRFILSCILVLGGIAVAINSKQRNKDIEKC